jgi:hypothetical protein
MTVFELHIEVEQKLQEQGSYQHDRIFPEAIDLALNQAQTEILEGIVSEEIAGTHVRLRHILPLIERNQSLIGIINLATESYSILTHIPEYVRHVLNCRGQRVTSPTCATITPVTTPGIRFITASIPLSEPTGDAPYYNNFVIEKEDETAIYTAPAAFTDRFQETGQKYELMQDIIDTLNVPGSAYTAEWDGDYLTIYSTVNPVTLMIDYDNKTATAATTTVNLNDAVHNMVSYTANTALQIDYVPARFVENDHTLYQKIALNKYTAPKKNEPFYTLAGDLLYIFYHKDSIVTNVQIDYIRKPKRISLILNRTSELDPSVHPQVVNRAVEILKQNIQDPSVQGDVQLNQLNTRK